MNYIKQISAAFERFDSEPGANPFHISLYCALFRLWNLNYFYNPLYTSRDELMRLSRIGSVNTYSKCLKDLHKFGFIKYYPSHNKLKGSQFYMFTFDTTCEQDVRHYTNNITNNTNMGKQAKIDFESEVPDEVVFNKSKKQKMKHENSNEYGPGVPPEPEHVKIYFAEKGFPPIEAEKFFNYFQSNGWLVGGRSKMKDWKAAARNWIINAQKFKNNAKQHEPKQQRPVPGKLSAPSPADYSEPL